MSVDTYRGWVDQMIGATVLFVPRLLAALIVLTVFYVGFRVLSRALRGVLNRTHLEPAIQDVILKGVKLVVFGFGIVMAASQIGINITSLVAGLGVVGLALSFAAQDTLQNFISGLTIYADRPFRLGDTIRVQDEFGTVERITLRSTRIRTLNNTQVIIPNKDVVNSKIVNHSMKGLLRIEIKFGIAYKESIDDARKAILSIMQGDERIVTEPAPHVVVSELADSSVNLILRIWTDQPLSERPIFFDYTERVKKALDRAGIESPFPHLQLFIDEAKGLRGLLGSARGGEPGAPTA